MKRNGNPRKRSVVIRGHPTSISLEDLYWEELKEMARRMRIPVSTLVARIEYDSAAANVSAAVRAYVVRSFRRPR